MIGHNLGRKGICMEENTCGAKLPHKRTCGEQLGNNRGRSCHTVGVPNRCGELRHLESDAQILMHLKAMCFVGSKPENRLEDNISAVRCRTVTVTNV